LLQEQHRVRVAEKGKNCIWQILLSTEGP